MANKHTQSPGVARLGGSNKPNEKERSIIPNRLRAELRAVPFRFIPFRFNPTSRNTRAVSDGSGGGSSGRLQLQPSK